MSVKALFLSDYILYAKFGRVLNEMFRRAFDYPVDMLVRTLFRRHAWLA